jgi:hypothetical protein
MKRLIKSFNGQVFNEVHEMKTGKQAHFYVKNKFRAAREKSQEIGFALGTLRLCFSLFVLISKKFSFYFKA